MRFLNLLQEIDEVSSLPSRAGRFSSGFLTLSKWSIARTTSSASAIAPSSAFWCLATGIALEMCSIIRKSPVLARVRRRGVWYASSWPRQRQASTCSLAISIEIEKSCRLQNSQLPPCWPPMMRNVSGMPLPTSEVKLCIASRIRLR